MKKIFKKIIIRMLILILCLSLRVNSVLAQYPVDRVTLSPKINISLESLQNAIQQVGIDKSQLTVEALPEWLNLEELENLKGLKITRSIITDQISTIDSDEGNERFDRIKFKFSYLDDAGNDFQAGEITLWKYHRPEGVRLFLHKSNRFNVRVVRFKPNLPRGKAVKEPGGRVQKAGIGISMLWFLLAQEQGWQDQKALIFNAEPPSQRAFQNINGRWNSLLFVGTPFYAKELRLAPLVHVGFNIPKLTKAQMRIVKDFFENKVDFIDETEQKIIIPFINFLSLNTPTSIETSI